MYIISDQDTRKGFTLIELLVGITVIAVIFNILITFVISAEQFNSIYIEQHLKSSNALTVLNIISNELRAANSISSLSTSSKLVMEYDTYDLSYDLYSNKVRRTKGGYSQYLTDDRVVGALSFSYPGTNLVTIICDDHSLEAFCRGT